MSAAGESPDSDGAGGENARDEPVERARPVSAPDDTGTHADSFAEPSDAEPVLDAGGVDGLDAGEGDAFVDPDGSDGFTDGDDDPEQPDGDDDLARIALAGARGSTRSANGRRGTARRRRRPDEPGRNRGGYSGPGPDPARDPQRLGALLPGYVADLGWEQPMADARVFARWAELVGTDVAAHCEPQSLRDGELRITAESTAWATQLRLLAGTLLARLVAELGPHVVTKLVISGPTAPSWKHGPRSVRNARGPRDTYG